MSVVEILDRVLTKLEGTTKAKRHQYYDKDGKPITRAEWSPLFDDMSYRRILRTETDEFVISTVWMGLDHQFEAEGPPLIFETMVFEHGSKIDLYCRRCTTNEEAVEQHKEAVDEYANPKRRKVEEQVLDK